MPGLPEGDCSAPNPGTAGVGGVPAMGPARGCKHWVQNVALGEFFALQLGHVITSASLSVVRPSPVAESRRTAHALAHRSPDGRGRGPTDNWPTDDWPTEN